MENLLQRISDLQYDLSQETSLRDKQVILYQYEDCKELLSKIYDPLYTLYITKSLLDKHLDEGRVGDYIYTDIYELMEDLHNRHITGHEAVDACLGFILQYPEYEEIIKYILDKDLRCGIGPTTINKCFHNLIQEFKVPLAKDYNEKHIDFNKSVYYLSRKFDGVRCLAFIHSPDYIQFFSRNGIEFHTLDNLKEPLSAWAYVEDISGVVLDGEICQVDDNGIENFNGIVGAVQRKNYTIPDPLYYLFGVYDLQEFEQGYTERDFSHIYDKLLSIGNMDRVKIAEQQPITSMVDLVDKITTRSIQWEGLILRKDSPVKFKRSNDMLKIKDFIEADYEVRGVVYGIKKIDKEDRRVCSSLMINHKGSVVNIGSGLSDQQRLDWIEDSDRIIGKTIIVKYFRESVDQYGQPSLYLPTLKGVRDYE